MKSVFAISVAAVAMLTGAAQAQTIDPIAPNADSTPAVFNGSWTAFGTGSSSCDSTGDCLNIPIYMSGGFIAPWYDGDGAYHVSYRQGIESTLRDLVPGCEYEVSAHFEGYVNNRIKPQPGFATVPEDNAVGIRVVGLGAANFVTDSAASWEKLSHTFVATAATHQLRIVSNDPGTGTEKALVDGAEIVALDPTCGNTPPPPPPSSTLQSQAAIKTMRYTREHVAFRLETSGQEHDNYLLQFSFENEDRSFENGARWTHVSMAHSDLGGQLSGEGAYVSAITGWDMNEGEESLWGYVIGAEYGQWEFTNEPDAEKLGLSAGLYAGRKLGERGLVEGHLTYTHFLNTYTDTSGATADVQSDRLIGHLSLSAKIGNSGGLTVVPYIEADYAIERTNAFTLAGNTSGASTTDVGMVSLGAEITTPWNPNFGQVYVQLQADQVFGQDPIALSSGSVMQPYEDVTGMVGLGWVSNTSYDSIGRVELSVSDIGNDDKTEARLEGHWERNF